MSRSRALTAVGAILLLSLPAAGGARAEVVTIVAGKDNTLFESATGHLSSGAGNSLFAGRTLQGRVLLTVAAGAVVYRERSTILSAA